MARSSWTAIAAVGVAALLAGTMAQTAGRPTVNELNPGPASRSVSMASDCARCASSPGRMGAANPLLHNVFMYGVGDNGSIWDYRVQMKPSQLGPLRAVGQVSATDEKNWYAGAATLVSACHILTSAQIVHDVERGKDRKDITFLVGDALTPVTAHRIKGGSGNPRFEGDCTNDWAVLRLDKCVGDEYGYLPMWSAGEDQMIEQEAISAGYPRGYAPKKGIVIDPGCNVNGTVTSNDRYGRQFTANCAQDFGDSGGLVVTNMSPVFPKIMGLTCGGPTDGKFQQRRPDSQIGVSNVITPVSAFYDKVKAVLTGKDEQKYIADHSSDRGQTFGPTESSGGRWQRDEPGVPPLPEMDMNYSTRPPGWLHSQYDRLDI